LQRGVDADAFAAAPWLLGGVKTLSYAINMAAQREAARRGADDVIFLSSGGKILEGPTSSVVWATGGVLRSVSPRANGILPGTTQQFLFGCARAAGWHTELCDARLDDLQEADVVWLVGSVRGPVDVVELDGRPRSRRPEIDREVRQFCGF
jgi:4-amino-4-deoxychorismate lyase